MRWTGHLARTGTELNTYNILIGKPYENKAIGKTTLIEG
jgi:hypothetical protein